MIIFLTLFLCFGLAAAIVAMVNPHLIEATIGKYWHNDSFYKRH